MGKVKTTYFSHKFFNGYYHVKFYQSIVVDHRKVSERPLIRSNYINTGWLQRNYVLKCLSSFVNSITNDEMLYEFISSDSLVDICLSFIHKVGVTSWCTHIPWHLNFILTCLWCARQKNFKCNVAIVKKVKSQKN